MTFQQPAWIPARAGATVALPASEGSAGRVVAVVASEGAVAAGWAGEVAVDLARDWSAAGARVVLADGGLTAPQLHTVLGFPVGEGLVDALRWGASVKRVARRPEGSGYFAITAGTAVADADAVYANPRWAALCAGFREAGVTLTVLVPSHDPSRGGVLSQATHVVVLSAPDEDVESLVAPWDGPILAVVGRESPSPGQVETPAPGDAESPVEEPESWSQPAVVDEDVSVPVEEVLFPSDDDEGATFTDEPGWAGAESAGDEETWTGAESAGDEESWVDPLAEGVPDGEPLPEEPTPAGEFPDWSAEEELFAAKVDEAPFREPASPPVPTFQEIVDDVEADAQGSNSRTRVLLLVLLLLVLAGAVAGWLGYLEIPGITPRGTGAAEAPAEPAATVAARPPTETSRHLPFSLALGAFQDVATAQALAQDMSARVSGVMFITAPVTVEGAVVHRVLAGPAADSADAVALATRVGEAAALAPSGWVARATPLAFQLGEMAERDAAERRSDVLAGLGVPAYVLAVTYSDGSTRFRVYAGAYADAAEASYLSALLEERGLSSASLSDRTGRLPE